MGSKGTQTSNTNQTTNQTQTYAPAGANYLTSALNQAQALAGQPTPTVPTAPVAGFSGQQQQAFNLAGNTGIQNPYLQTAQGYFAPQGAQAFYNPMAANVTAQLQNIYGQQNLQNTANLTQSAGGVGADRIAVGQGNLANQQALAAGQTYANLYNQAAQQAQSAGYATAGLGAQAQQANIQDVQALLGAGGLQQQLAQAQLNAPYQQQLAQMALPYQLSQFYSGTAGALAPGLGGTTTGTGTSAGQTTSQYNPSVGSQILGGGLMLASAFGKGTGGAVPYASGGHVNPYAFDDGGVTTMPINISGGLFGQKSFIPQGQLSQARAEVPHLNLTPQMPQMPDMSKQGQQSMKDMITMGKDLRGLRGKLPSFSGLFGGNAGDDSAGGTAGGGSGENTVEGQSAADYDYGMRGGVFDSGGSVNPYRFHFADAGDVPDDDLGAGPPSDADRAAGLADLRKAMVEQYGVNPNDPIVEPTKEKGEAWRAGVDADRGLGQTAQALPGPTPKPSTIALAYAPEEKPPAGLPGPITAPKGLPSLPLSNRPVASAAPPEIPPAAAEPPPPPADTESGFHLFGKEGAISKWMHDPQRVSLMMAGLGAWTPQGIAGGFHQGMEYTHGQQTFEQQAKRLEQEANFHAEDMKKTGWTFNKEGTMTPTPGGPADPDYLEKAAKARLKIPFGWEITPEGAVQPRPGGPADPHYLHEKTEATTRESWAPAGWLTTDAGAIHPITMERSTGKLKDSITGAEPTATDKVTPRGAPKGATLSDYDAQAIARYVVATGDESAIRNATGANAENKGVVQKYLQRERQAKNVDDAEYARRKQDFAANGISKNAAARTRATREENLNMILRATAAAIPAALEESDKVERYGGLVPLTSLIQKGEIAADADPHLIPFAMANLQLAEHWARAMNPTGVMRESDRDKALSYLDTARSKGAYKTAVLQLQKQVTRERDSIMAGQPGQSESGAVIPGYIPGEGGGGGAPPPASMLKEGVHTKFKNGETWTLRNGQPVKVP